MKNLLPDLGGTDYFLLTKNILSVNIYCMEIWKNIKNIEGYEVSSLGNIRSLNGCYHSTFYGRPIIRQKTIRNLSGFKLSSKGYKRVRLNGSTYFVHRIVAETFLDNTNNYPQVNHIDGNKLNNQVDNLEWVTNQQNRDHAVKYGLIACRKNGLGKITEEQLKDILVLRKQGLSQSKIAKRFNVVQQTIQKILKKLV